MPVRTILLAAAAAAAGAGQPPSPSRVVSVEVTRSAAAGRFGGVEFRRVTGIVHGVVAAGEPIAGLAQLAGGRDVVAYDTGFDMTVPVDPSLADGIVVEATNRGLAVMQPMMNRPVARPASGATPGAPADDGFLFAQHLSLAHVQWQAGIAAGVPETAQGIGEAAIRDFGRWLGAGDPAGRAGLPTFRHRILAGISQSAWLVNTLIAEGFNADPVTGRAVYQGAFTRNGNGVVLGINTFAGGGRQQPYIVSDRAPLTPAQLLSRPRSDPAMVDVGSLTDFYRVRASVFAGAPGPAGLHRYATAAPHAPGGLVPAGLVFGTMRCNAGVVVPLDPVSDAPYLRPLLLGLATAIGTPVATPHALPARAPFVLVPAPADPGLVNLLPGTALRVPAIAPNGAPAAGIPLVEAVLPLGTASPPALAPLDTRSIAQTCGNFAGWRPFPIGELVHRYGSRAGYLRRARAQASRLAAAGYLLAEDEDGVVRAAERQLPAGFD